jgi:hypothetical protein
MVLRKEEEDGHARETIAYNEKLRAVIFDLSMRLRVYYETNILLF